MRFGDPVERKVLGDPRPKLSGLEAGGDVG
jgi:hypothetical protein